jgi:paraquat-inducible protein B
MTDERGANPGADVPAALVARKRGLSLVWIVPILAAGIGAWLWWDALQQRGPEIRISFVTADGLEAGKTKIRFKSVDVGEVESVSLKPDLSGVTVTARMEHATESLLHADSRFWVVRPRVGLGGVSGLGTLLSGAFVAVDPVLTGAPSRDFSGLEEPPQTPLDAPGLKLHLSAESLGSISVGSPVSYDGLVVGRIEAYELLGEGQGLGIDAYVEPEYASRVHEGTRFWNSSGLDVSFGAAGLKFSSESLASLLTGGVEFDTSPDAVASPVARSGATYHLFPSRAASLEVFTDKHEAVMYFTGSLRGLEPGAPVEIRGIRLGTVTSFGLEDKTIDKALSRVVIDIEPERIGRTLKPGETMQDRLTRLIGAGLRARLETSSLLTGALLVDVIVDPSQPAVLHNVPGELEIPTVASESEALAASADQLPALVTDMRSAIAGLAALVGSSDAQHLAGDIRDVGVAARGALERADATIASIQTLLAQQSDLQLRVASAMDEISSGMRSMRQLADTLDRQPESLIKGKSPAPGDR